MSWVICFTLKSDNSPMPTPNWLVSLLCFQSKGDMEAEIKAHWDPRKLDNAMRFAEKNQGMALIKLIGAKYSKEWNMCVMPIDVAKYHSSNYLIERDN